MQRYPSGSIRRGAVVAAVAVLLTACGSASGASGGATPGARQAPAFSLKGLDGQDHSLSGYRGKVVMINFWATWCVPCRAEMPDIEHEYRAHRDAGLVVLGIDPREGQDPATQFVHDLGVSYPILFDPKGQVYDSYQVTALPQTFIVDRRGSIRLDRLGQVSRAQLEEEITAALAAS
jgi:cytochrome c biogenesis protein CcmG/thiol:disulfide interchange protein DsbE